MRDDQNPVKSTQPRSTGNRYINSDATSALQTFPISSTRHHPTSPCSTSTSTPTSTPPCSTQLRPRPNFDPALLDLSFDPTPLCGWDCVVPFRVGPPVGAAQAVVMQTCIMAAPSRREVVRPSTPTPTPDSDSTPTCLLDPTRPSVVVSTTLHLTPSFKTLDSASRLSRLCLWHFVSFSSLQR